MAVVFALESFSWLKLSGVFVCMAGVILVGWDDRSYAAQTLTLTLTLTLSLTLTLI